ncbi:MAG: dimethyladenosine transferase, rRNA (adenine1518-N6/adenine1519-N6)-dimethyltransferase [Candidatus Parcubacteria bacterium]
MLQKIYYLSNVLHTQEFTAMLTVMTTPDSESKEGFAHKKSLGQNFLTTGVVPHWMCEAGAVGAGDTIIEIGPGTGALTRTLLARGATVYAIETDDRAVAVLRETFASEIAEGQLHLIYDDVRTFAFESLPIQQKSYKIVANIPYYLSGFLLRHCLELPNPPTTIVFLMQKEVVERIARDKKSSLLSLSVRVYGEPKYYKTVSRGHFKPAPNVDSAILVVKNINHERLPTIAERERFFALLHEGLGQRRKQLIGALTHRYERAALEAIFAHLNFLPTVRGEDLSIDNWLSLYQALTDTL